LAEESGDEFKVLNTVSQLFKVIGLMSGTSLDGIDAALLTTDGESVVRPGPALTLPYRSETRAMLHAALSVARSVTRGDPVPPEVSAAERVLTDAHADAVALLLARAQLRASDVDYVGFHGQTVLHRPAERWTWQIGDGAALARATGIAVVNDFRSADVAAGGQGAPFVPLYHRVLARTRERPLVVVNIGGVANVTYVGADDSVIAFDTGPGNAALDDWAFAHTGLHIDLDGRLARAGRVDEKRLAQLLGHPMFAIPPPKSFDRFDFPASAVDGLSGPDGAATLTAFTAESIARAREHFPSAPKGWIISGGGRHNPVLMEELRRRLGGDVKSAEDVGWRGGSIEAEAFAYLAVRSVKGLPLSLPSTTGVPYPMPGGRLHRP
jgi:anhydro-N-acetylmuramic acid kinase